MRLIQTDIGNYFCPDDPGESRYEDSPPRRSVTDEEGSILRRLAKDKYVLEIGTGLGVSTKYLAETALEVVTVDPDHWVQDPCLPNVIFLRSRPDREFDLVFIDGNHAYEDVLNDIRLSMEIPEIIIHDTNIEDVKRAIKTLNLKTIRIYDTPCQLGIFTPL